MVLGRQSRSLCLALVTSLAAVVASALPYGINAHIPTPEQLGLVAGMGVEWVRIDLRWDYVEPARGEYDWSTYDAIAEAAAVDGLKVYATLSSTPAWATAGTPSSGVPNDAQAWYDFCFRAAQRYRGRIEYFGLWNEPNLSRFWAGTRAQYVEIVLKTGSRAIRAANPRAKVCGPELAHLESADWSGWLGYVLGQASDALDIVTHHVYPSGTDPGSVIDALTRDRGYSWEPHSVHEILQNASWFPRPFWLTETGYNSQSPNYLGELAQSSFLSDLLQRLFFPDRSVDFVDKVFIYELSDDPGYPGDTFGILGPPPDYRKKAAYYAYQRFATGAAVDDAEVVGASLPAVLRPGEQVDAKVTVRNTGTTTWTETNGYRLGVVGDHAIFAAVRQRLASGEAVPPGGLATFTVPYVAPLDESLDGLAEVTRWRMVREGVWWFGDTPSQRTTLTTADRIVNSLYVPGMANGVGLKGTRWHADLWIYNAGPEPAEMTVVALEQGKDNSTPRAAELTVPPGAQRRIDDVLGSLFGLVGTAALRLDIVRGDVSAAGKSYTPSGGGTYGETVPALPPGSAVGFGSSAALRGLAYSEDRSAGSRTNLGFVNPTSLPITVQVALFGDDSVQAGTLTYDLAPFGFRQANDVYRAAGSPDVTNGSATVRTVTSGGSVIAYASVVDNISGEPTLVTPSESTDEPLVVATAAHNNGLQGSRWRTDLQLFNPGTDPAGLEVELLPAGSSPAPPAATLDLPGLDGAFLPDVVSQVFNFVGSAALRITPRTGAAAAFSTTYNVASPGRPGQGVPAARQSEAALFGEEVRLVGLSGSADPASGSRSNIGFVNVSDLPVDVKIALYRSPSTPVGTLTATLAPLEWRQLTDVFRLIGADVDDGFAIVTTSTPAGRFLTYASVVDNASGDPVLVRGW